jgi:antitoxin component YwqK of YwqJK toxin-antitoxin module
VGVLSGIRAEMVRQIRATSRKSCDGEGKRGPAHSACVAALLEWMSEVGKLHGSALDRLMPWHLLKPIPLTGPETCYSPRDEVNGFGRCTAAGGKLCPSVPKATGLAQVDEWFRSKTACPSGLPPKVVSYPEELGTIGPPHVASIQCHKKDGTPFGRSTAWHINGVPWHDGHYDAKGRHHGKWVYWFPHGQKVAEGRYDHGHLEGVWTGWFVGGGKREQGSYHGGKRRGSWRAWYANGRLLFEGIFGRRSRVTWTFYYENGRKAATREMMGSVRDGRTVQWGRDGKKKREGHHVRGRAQGDWSYWDPSGRLLRVETYRTDELVRTVDGNGKLIPPKKPKSDDEPLLPPLPPR